MIFVNQQLPYGIAAGVTRKWAWSTNITQSIGGQETAIPNWTKARLSFDFSHAIRTARDFDAIAQHFHMVRGRAKSWPLRDALDYSVATDRGVLTTVTAFTSYKLGKTYGTGGDTYTRAITRPVASSVLVFRTRSSVTTDITASCTVDGTTGGVAITGGVVIGGDTLAWSGQFLVPVRFDMDELPAVVNYATPDGQLLVQCDGVTAVEVRE